MGSQLPQLACCTGAIRCYSRHSWVASLDGLVRGFEAAVREFLPKPSWRQIAISGCHPGARLVPDPEPLSEPLPSCHSTENLTVHPELFFGLNTPF